MMVQLVIAAMAGLGIWHLHRAATSEYAKAQVPHQPPETGGDYARRLG